MLTILNVLLHLSFRSKDFRPTFEHFAEIRALVPPGTPMMACTAMASKSIKKEMIEIS